MPSPYKYPLTVGTPPYDKFIKFDVKPMRHVLRNLPNDGTIASAVIYLPESALRNSLAVTWSDSTNLGLGLASLAYQSAGKNGAAGAAMSAAGAKNALTTGIEGMASAVGKNTSEFLLGAALAVGKTVANMVVPDDVQTMVGAYTGFKTNPRTEVLFESQQYRTYQFDFMMVPRNYDEGVAIDNIVRFFQFYMLPRFEADDTVIGYPYEFAVGVYNNLTPDGALPTTSQIKRVMHIGRCIVKSINVDHAAGGKVAFVCDRTNNSELFPVATSLSLELQEVRLLSRGDQEITRGLTTDQMIMLFPDPRA